MDLIGLVVICTMISIATSDSTSEYDPSLKHIVDYMENNLSTYQVTVTFTSAKELGNLGSKIVESITDEFSSVLIDESVFEEIPAVKSLNNLWRRAIYQSKLKVVVMEVSHNRNILQELDSAIFFLMEYSPLVRGQCIIFLINGNGQSLEPFLRHAWSRDFLDLTVVEWVNTTQTWTLATTEILNSEVLIHLFNPFQDKYTKDKLSNTTDILPHKTRDLHGYHFYAISSGAPGFNFRKRYKKSDVESMEHLMDTLNFTLTYEGVNGSEDSKVLLADLYRPNASREHPVDFILSLVCLKPPDNSAEDISAFMNELVQYLPLFVDRYSFKEFHFLVLQEKISELRISLNFLTTFVTLSAMGLIFVLSSRVMRFNKKIWSPVKIARALMGGTLESRRQMKLVEKILSTTLYFVSIVIMTMTSDELIKMSVSKREVLQCTTFEELVDSKMRLLTDKITSDYLLLFEKKYPKLQKI
ncbi:hypothetical protein QAD02_010920 [Eretmocerus hayati]|uniref:Uncharacterized protein n=1 Tax=Eretmocerus hayati TaxID=131215 RepID=A0ACC2NVK6_9HYME|nr:hypothetical protein QAD02_010920 [Eretmocerus hayati]